MKRRSPDQNGGPAAVARRAPLRAGKTYWLAAISTLPSGIAIVLVLQSIDWGKILPSLGQLRPTTIAIVTFCMVANFLLACIRFERALFLFGASVSWRIAAHAFSIGGLANHLLLNIVGQSLTRAMVLQSAGVPLGLTVVATYVERLVAFAVLGSAAVIAALFLFGAVRLQLQEGGAYFLALGVGLSATLGIAGIRAAAVVMGRAQLREVKAATSQLISVVALTALVFFSMFVAYLVLVLDFAPTESVANLSAAIVVIMFVASLPISWAGWGLREFGAIYALNEVGLPKEAALIIAITIGTIGLLVNVSAGLVTSIDRLGYSASGIQSNGTVAHPLPHADGVLFWTLGILIACLILFQLRVPTGAGDVTVNAADPLATTGLFFAAYRAAAHRFLDCYPRLFLTGILALAIALLLGAIAAKLGPGLSQWALLNRLLGFLVLIGYAATPGLLIQVAGERGRRVIADTFLLSAALVCLIQLTAYVIHHYVTPIPVGFFGLQFGRDHQLEGFAQNPNAFAFQLLMVMSVLIAFHPPIVRRTPSPWPLLSALTLMVVIIVGHSRAGVLFGCGISALAIFVSQMKETIRPNTRQFALLLLTTVVTVCLAAAFHGSIQHFLIEPLNAQWRTSANASDALRWQTMRAGIQQWLHHPLLGEGLGSFLLAHRETGALALGIHSVPIWFLAEMGLVGCSAYLLFIVSLLIAGLKEDLNKNMRYGLIFATTIFILFGQVHDVFYQRTFWFCVGLMIVSASRPHERRDAITTR